MKKLNVLLITSKFPRFKGDPQPPFTYDLAKKLVKENCIVHVIAPHAPGAKKHEKFEGIFIHRFKYFFPSNLEKLAYGPGIPANIRTSFLAKLQIPFFLLSEIIFSKSIIKKINPDLVHVHWAIPQGISALFLKKPFIVTTYGGEVFLSKNFHITPIFNHIIKKSKTTYAITQGLKSIMNEFGIKGNIEVIPLGVDLDKFRPNISGWKEVKSKYCKKDEQMILCVGRLVEKKGIQYLLPAFSEVLKKIPKCKLVIVGDGYLNNSLKEQTKKLGLENKVFFTKEISHKDLPKYYCAADLFVLPSIIDKTGNRETQGVVYLEAMACKCPVIGTNTGGIPDVIQDKETGLLVKEKDPKELSKAIILLLTNKKLSQSLINNSTKSILSKFNWRNIAKKYIRIYKKII